MLAHCSSQFFNCHSQSALVWRVACNELVIYHFPVIIYPASRETFVTAALDVPVMNIGESEFLVRFLSEVGFAIIMIGVLAPVHKGRFELVCSYLGFLWSFIVQCADYILQWVSYSFDNGDVQGFSPVLAPGRRTEVSDSTVFDVLSTAVCVQ